MTVTKIKSQGRILAGKRLAEFNKLHRWNKNEKSKIKNNETQITATQITDMVPLTQITARKDMIPNQTEIKDKVANPETTTSYFAPGCFVGFAGVCVAAYIVYHKLRKAKRKTTHTSKQVSDKKPSKDLFMME